MNDASRTNPNILDSGSLLQAWRWLFLVTAALLIPLTTGNRLVAAAAWLGPLAMLRFLRMTETRKGLAIGGAVHALAFGWAWYGAYPVPVPVLMALGAMFFFPYAVDRLVAPRLPAFASTLVLPSAWVAMEFAFTTLPLMNGTPIGTWGSLAYTQHANLPLLQVASVTGLYGITFLIAWTASAVNLVWERGIGKRTVKRAVAVVATTLALVLAAGGVRIATAPENDDVLVAGVVVHNDHILKRTWGPINTAGGLTQDEIRAVSPEIVKLHEELFTLSEDAVAEGAQIVAWAEDNAVVFNQHAPALIERGRAFAREHEVALFMGMAVLTPGELVDNQVVSITPSGDVASTYLKAIPAPGELSRPGDGRISSFDTPWARLAAAICFDFDFPALIRQAGAADVDIMINAADDSEPIDPLHPTMAILRSVENGFSQIRPAHEARSIAVDPFGRVVARQEASEDAARVLLAGLPTEGATTLYARIGDLFAGLAIATLLALVTGAALTVARRRLQPPYSTDVQVPAEALD